MIKSEVSMNHKKEKKSKTAGNQGRAKPAYAPATTTVIVPTKKKCKPSILKQMRQRLQGGHFRWLNEQLYTQSSNKAVDLMGDDPRLYDQYHDGFREQTKGWPEQPVDAALKWLKLKPDSWIVADLGCGDAALAAAAHQKVYSFDLVAKVPGVVACNIAKVPLPNHSIHAAVFCLSLMGTDYGAFLAEASRLLKPKGRLWIAEVRSRFVSESGNAQREELLNSFVQGVQALGFREVDRKLNNTHFLTVEFEKEQHGKVSKDSIAWPKLKPCIYKRR